AVCVSASGNLPWSRANTRDARTRISRRSGGLRPDRCNGSGGLGCRTERYLTGIGPPNNCRSLTHAIHVVLESHIRCMEFPNPELEPRPCSSPIASEENIR